MPNKKQSKLKSILLNLLMTLIVIFVMIVILEIIIRIFLPQNLNYTEFDSTLMFRHIPNFETQYHRQEFSNIITFNSKGLRDYEYSYEKPKGTYRILLVGSSFSQALQVPLNQTYENILEKKLNNELKRKYEVLNGAVGGYSTAQELSYLRTEGLKYKPDMILLDFSSRDVAENSITPLVSIENNKLVEHIPVKISMAKSFLLSCSRYSHLCALTQTVILEGAKNQNIIRYLLAKSKISSGDAKSKRDVGIVDMFYKNNTPKASEAIQKTFMLIQEIKSFADENKIQLVMFVIPNREQVDKNRFEDFVRQNNLNEKDLEPDKMQKLAAKFASENNITYFDMLPYFQQKNANNTFYFNIDGHWNSKGHQLAADLLYDYLVKNNLIPKNNLK